MKLSFLEKLEVRERLLLLYLGTSLLVILLVTVLMHFYNLRQTLAAEAQESSVILGRLHHLRAQITRLAPAKTAPDKTQFFAQVNEMLKRHDLQPISISQKKEGLKISVRLQSVLMPNFLKFLYDAEYRNGGSLSISSLLIRTAVVKKELYDVNITLRSEGSANSP